MCERRSAKMRFYFIQNMFLPPVIFIDLFRRRLSQLRMSLAPNNIPLNLFTYRNLENKDLFLFASAAPCICPAPRRTCSDEFVSALRLRCARNARRRAGAGHGAPSQFPPSSRCAYLWNFSSKNAHYSLAHFNKSLDSGQ